MKKFFLRALTGSCTVVALSFSLAAWAAEDDACKQDFEKLCPGMEISMPNMKKCFATKKEQLSESCKKYYEMASNPKGALKAAKDDSAKKDKGPSKTDQVKAKAEAKKKEVKGKANDLKNSVMDLGK